MSKKWKAIGIYCQECGCKKVRIVDWVYNMNKKRTENWYECSECHRTGAVEDFMVHYKGNKR